MGNEMPEYKEESPSEGDDPRATNDRRMFYYSAAARDVQTYQTSWVSSPDLIALKLQYLPIYKVFRCTFCITACNRNSPKGCIHPANLAKHLRNFHDSRHSLEEIQQQINAVFSNYPPHEGLHPLIPSFPDGILPPAIPGVTQETGFYCTLCRTTRKGQKKAAHAKLITHCNKEHPGHRSRSLIQKGIVQGLYYSGRSTFYFPVDPFFSEAADEEPAQQAYQQDGMRITSTHDAAVCKAFDPRDRSPLLTKLKWDLLLQGIPSEDIISLVSNPTKDELPYCNNLLRVWVQTFFMDINNYLAKHQDSPLLQQVMYVGYEPEVVSDKRMRHLNNKTVENYSQLFFKLLLFLIRYHLTDTHPNIKLNLTSSQQDHIDKLLDVLSEGDTPSSKEAGLEVILDLGYSLLQQGTISINNSSWNQIIYKFLVFTSVREGGVFEEATNIAPRVTRLLWLFRAVVIKKVMIELKDFRGTPGEIRAMSMPYTKVLSRAHHSPFQTLLSVGDDIFGAAFSEDRPANCQWLDDDFLSLKIENTIFHLPTLSKAIKQLLDDLIKKFKEDVCLGLPEHLFISCPQGQKISDNYRDFSLNHNFLFDSNNPWFRGHRDVLIKAILNNSELVMKFVESVTDGTIQWKMNQVNSWLSVCTNWEEDALALTHLVYGGVARKPELLGMKLRNVPSGFRNLLIWDDMVCLLSYYHKNQALSGKRKWIARFLPPDFSDTFIKWIAYIRPAQAYFYRVTGYPRSATIIEDNLWTTGGNIITDKKFSQIFERVTGQYYTASFGVQIWRHANIGIVRRHNMNLQVDENKEDAGEDAIEDLQAGHGSAVAMSDYARTTDRSSFLGEYFFLQYANCSKRYHSLLQLVITPPKQLTDDERRWKANASKVMGLSLSSSSSAHDNPATFMQGYSHEDLKHFIRQEFSEAVQEATQFFGTEVKEIVSTCVVDTMTTLFRNPNFLLDLMRSNNNIPQAAPPAALQTTLQTTLQTALQTALIAALQAAVQRPQ
ncbi:hypothetical protein C367_06137 [Cryptococcus neoformans Ze90-1]|nr:hypothetical protein C367_06137 [Cryptococcus neoformans var. grubii Ze90-1]